MLAGIELLREVRNPGGAGRTEIAALAAHHLHPSIDSGYAVSPLPSREKKSDSQ